MEDIIGKFIDALNDYQEAIARRERMWAEGGFGSSQADVMRKREAVIAAFIEAVSAIAKGNRRVESCRLIPFSFGRISDKPGERATYKGGWLCDTHIQKGGA